MKNFFNEPNQIFSRDDYGNMLPVPNTLATNILPKVNDEDPIFKEHLVSRPFAGDKNRNKFLRILYCQATITFSLNVNYFYRLKLLKNVS